MRIGEGRDVDRGGGSHGGTGRRGGIVCTARECRGGGGKVGGRGEKWRKIFMNPTHVVKNEIQEVIWTVQFLGTKS